LLIDATLKHPMPPIALPARPYMERAAELWAKLGLPRLALQSPWHGYELGDWSEAWEDFAKKTTSGDWEANGVNTLARRQGGLKPETSVRLVETDREW
jgi:4-hydroxy-3-polyprenylbenzoate decarboxylase